MHILLTGYYPKGVDKINSSSIKSLVITDQLKKQLTSKVQKKIRSVSTAPMLAQAILNISQEILYPHFLVMKLLNPFMKSIIQFILIFHGFLNGNMHNNNINPANKKEAPENKILLFSVLNLKIKSLIRD